MGYIYCNLFFVLALWNNVRIRLLSKSEKPVKACTTQWKILNDSPYEYEDIVTFWRIFLKEDPHCHKGIFFSLNLLSSLSKGDPHF